jgi:DNA-binding IclR family transcriptional regulator
MSAIAETVEMTRSTTHRYLATWVAMGFLERVPRSRRYRRPPPD